MEALCFVSFCVVALVIISALKNSHVLLCFLAIKVWVVYKQQCDSVALAGFTQPALMRGKTR